MTFREPDFREYCYVCEALASATCQRCQRAVCAKHRTSKDARCPQCEAEYYDEPGRLADAGAQSRFLGTLTAFLGIPGAATFAALGMTAAAAGIGIGALAIIGFLTVKAAHHNRHRKKFLKQGASEDRKLLGDGTE